MLDAANLSVPVISGLLCPIAANAASSCASISRAKGKNSAPSSESATIHDFKHTGDFVTVAAGAFPILVILSKDGTLSAHHNICRHRGALLVEGESGNVGASLVCPYHHWTYGLDGALRGAPNAAACFPDLDRSTLGLKPAALGVFQGLVFVNPNPNADFTSWVGTVAQHTWPHDLTSSELTEGATLTYHMKCDWKVFIENALDGYHLSYLHKNTLGGPKPQENIWERHGDHMIWYATDDDEGNRHRIPAKVRDEAWGTTRVKHTENSVYGGVYFLFPNTLITPHPYGISISWLIGLEAGRCEMPVRNWVGPWQSKDDRKHIPGFNKETDLITSNHWKKHPLETGDFQTEDVWICERVQAGLASPAFEPGPLAQGAGAEDPVTWFRASMLNAMAE